VRAAPLREGWLLGPSGRAGRQWLDQVARSGVVVASVRPLTIRNLMLDLARPELVRRGERYLDPIGQVALVDGILRKGLSAAKRGLGVQEITPGLTQALARCLDELRCVGVDSVAACPGLPEEFREKHEFLGELQARYREALSARGVADYGSILEMARERLRAGDEELQRVTLLQPVDLKPRGREEELLALWPGPRVTLETDQPAHADEPALATTALEALRWMGIEGVDHSEVLRAEGDRPTVLVEEAECEEREVEGVLRECLRRGIALDEVELLHTDEEAYLPRIEGLLARLYRSGRESTDEEDEELPLTCAEGFPCAWTRPGRALRAWVAWLREGATGEGLARMVADGLVVIPEPRNGAFSAARLASALRSLRLGSKLAGAMERLAEAAEGDEAARRGAGIPAAVQQPLEALLEGVRACGIEVESGSVRVLDRALRFMEKCAGARTERDKRARRVLMSRLQQAREWLNDQEGDGGLDIWRWLDRLPREARVDGSGPEPGCLHVSRWDQGGHSGRRLTALVGLSEDRFPMPGGIDPMLSDQERRELSGTLRCGADRPGEQRAALARLLARLRGVLRVSFPRRTLSDGAEHLPSSVVEEMRGCLGLAAEERDPSDVGGALALDARDWWRGQLRHGLSELGRAELFERFAPNLAAGERALLARASEEFTEYDGYVPDAGPAHDPTRKGGPELSVTGLETLGTCPRRYFFKAVLGVKPPDWMRGREDEWLDAAESGELLHSVLYKYVSECIEQHEGILRREGLPRLLEILEQEAEAWRRSRQAPSEAAFQRRMRELRRAMRIFLIEEENEQARRGARPALLEYMLGERGQPLHVPVAGIGSIPLHGKADRVDRIETPEGARYEIIDYKTGRDRRYKAGDAFDQGRYLQPYLYLEMLAIRLREGIERGGDVAGFGYFFPGVKASGSRLSWAWNEEFAAQGQRILSRLIRLLRAGAFPATNKAEDCASCDYRMICEPVKETIPQSQMKLKNPANVMISPFAELRDKNGSRGGEGS
jgi:ATP-dependent helicase/nuclease subunit B